MTDHPAKGLSKRQREAFEQIAVGNPRLHPKTIEILMNRGLIVAYMEVVGYDRFGAIKVPFYYVPLALHMQWCEWCSEQPEPRPCGAAEVK